MTISKAMNISLTGLNANQAALNVVSHNIANMNTEGYVKQRVNFAEVRTKTNDATVRGQIASLSGVKIASITTAANDYLNNYYRNQKTLGDGLQADADIATGLSKLMDELSGAGLHDSLANFYNSANSLNQNPTDYSLRVNFAEQAKNVANKFNSMNTSITSYKESLVGDGESLQSAQVSQVGTDVTSLNKALSDLADVNRQLSANSTDSSLTSKRDQILASISGYANVTTKIDTNGNASVKIGNTDLVKGGTVVGTLSITKDADILVTNEKGNIENITDSFTAGSIGGTLSGVSAVNDALAGLDTLAAAFADIMNGIQTYSNGDTKACYYDRANDKLVASNAANVLFESKGGGAITAGNIKINDDIITNPDLIAAARIDTNTATNPDWEKAVGNGNNALEFYNSQNYKSADPNDPLKNLTINDFILGLSTKAALNANSKQEQADTQNSIADGISNQILSETGVNLDEELANMIMYQQAYNASARVFACCVDVYDRLVALGT